MCYSYTYLSKEAAVLIDAGLFCLPHTARSFGVACIAAWCVHKTNKMMIIIVKLALQTNMQWKF